MLWTGKIVKACVVAMFFGGGTAWAENPAGASEDAAGVSGAPEVSEAPAPLTREFTRWERVVRGFRREHHFGVTGGYLRGNWNVSKFGPVTDMQIGDDGFWTRGEYTYHLQIYEGFGYLLGSSLGTTHTRTADLAALKPPTSLIYPGVVVGAVYNISPRVRLLGAGSINLERYDGLRALALDSAGGQEDSEISITMESYDAQAALDIFVAINLAIRIEGHDRYQLYRKPRNAGDKPVNADIERFDRWYGAGIVYHML